MPPVASLAARQKAPESSGSRRVSLQLPCVVQFFVSMRRVSILSLLRLLRVVAVSSPSPQRVSHGFNPGFDTPVCRATPARRRRFIVTPLRLWEICRVMLQRRAAQKRCRRRPMSFSVECPSQETPPYSRITAVR